ncbi:helix-turn-helix domain-containing protein [Enterococcus gallinarum]|uniref:helix-turn-helix domain-containing protein n=1 Tax=Enterococcus gallinarum TaxID=1353 RepID=UPI003D6BA1BE
MSTKKPEDIAIGQRIKDIRAFLKMDQKTFANTIGCTVSALSNWENGRNKPNDIMLREIAKIGSVSVRYLLTGQDNEKSKLEADINHLTNGLITHDKEIEHLQSIVQKLKEERQHGNTNKFRDTYLSKILGIDNSTIPTNDLYDQTIEEYLKKILAVANSKDLLRFELDEIKKVMDLIESDENYYSPLDRENPEFESHGVSQMKIAEYLQSIPYFLDYTNTMKVLEYAEFLMSKEENRFNP